MTDYIYLNASSSGQSSFTRDWVWQLGEVCDRAGSAGRDGEMQSDSGPKRDGQGLLPSVLLSPWQREEGQGFLFITVLSFRSLGSNFASRVKVKI